MWEQARADWRRLRRAWDTLPQVSRDFVWAVFLTGMAVGSLATVVIAVVVMGGAA